MKKRILSLLLALLFASLASCTDSGAETGETAAETAKTVENTEDEGEENAGEEAALEEAAAEDAGNARIHAKDNLPEDLRFDGETVNIFNRGSEYTMNWDAQGTDNSGDLVLDAIWQRNLKVEERFGLKMNIQPTPTDGDETGRVIKQFVMAGDDDYDIIASTGGTTVMCSLDPYLYELSDLEYLDITQPWWRTDAIMSMSLDGRHYHYLMGDHTLNTYLKCGVIFANKTIYNNVFGDPDGMYTTVLDYDWTWDELMKKSEAAYVDTDGNGKINYGDQIGFLWTGDDGMTHVVMSCDPVLYTRTEEGRIDFSVITAQHNSDLVDKLIRVFHETTGVWKADKGIDDALNYFAEGATFFYLGRLSAAVGLGGTAMREMEDDYGILPLPMYEKEQGKYVTNIHSSATATCVPKSLREERADMIGAVLESWASEAYRSVLTPFIESAMKHKYSRDEYSGQVIDIVFETACLNTLEEYSANCSGIYAACFTNLVKNGKNNFASTAAKVSASAQKQIDKYTDAILSQ